MNLLVDNLDLARSVDFSDPSADLHRLKVLVKQLFQQITGASSKMSLSQYFCDIFSIFLVNPSDSSFKNIPDPKIYKVVCFLLT